MRKLLYLIIPVLFVVLLTTSCEEQNAQNLIGEWELSSKPYEEFDYKWKFTNSQVIIFATDNRIPYDGAFDTCQVGNYVLKNGVLTIAAEAAFCNYTIFVGDWDIEKLDNSFLTLRREAENGSTWYEFKKIVE